MRITNTSITNNYLKSLNRNKALMNRYSQQVYGTRFNKMSEDPAAGVRALQVRRNLNNLETSLGNVNKSKNLYDAADGAVRQVSTIASNVSERFLLGMNGATGTDVDRGSVATELRALQSEMLNLMNTKFSDKYIFGGTNTNSVPFTLQENAAGDTVLHYNGKEVSTMTRADVDAMNAAFVDIGLGLSMDGQQVDETTALPVTFKGAEVFGFGPDNLYNLIGDMIDMLESSNFDASAAGDLLEKFNSAVGSTVRTTMVKIGAQQAYLEYTIDRLESERLILNEKQQDLMFKPADEAILDFTMQDYVYNAALQMGQRLIQPTLFNFIS